MGKDKDKMRRGNGGWSKRLLAAVALVVIATTVAPLPSFARGADDQLDPMREPAAQSGEPADAAPEDPSPMANSESCGDVADENAGATASEPAEPDAAEMQEPDDFPQSTDQQAGEQAAPDPGPGSDGAQQDDAQPAERQKVPADESDGAKAPAAAHSITVNAPDDWYISITYTAGGVSKRAYSNAGSNTAEGVDAGSAMQVFVRHPTALGGSLDIGATSSSADASVTGTTRLSDWQVQMDVSVDAAFDADATLAVGAQGPTHTLSYDANGVAADNMPQAVTAATGATVTTPEYDESPTAEGYEFHGWNTAPDGSGQTVSSGESHALAGDVILYAQWYDNRGEYSFTVELGEGSEGITGMRIVVLDNHGAVTNSGFVTGTTASVSGVKTGQAVDVYLYHASGQPLMPGTIDAHGASWIDTTDSTYYYLFQTDTYDLMHFSSGDSYNRIEADTTITLSDFAAQHAITTDAHEGHAGGVTYDVVYNGNEATSDVSAPAGATVSLRRYPTDTSVYGNHDHEYWKYYIDSYTLTYQGPSGQISETHAGDEAFTMPNADVHVTPVVKAFTYIDIVEVGDVFSDLMPADGMPPFTGAVHSDVYGLGYELWDRDFDNTWCDSLDPASATLTSVHAGDELSYGVYIYIKKFGYKFAPDVTVRAAGHEVQYHSAYSDYMDTRFGGFATLFPGIFTVTVDGTDPVAQPDSVSYDGNGGAGTPGPDEQVGDDPLHVTFAVPARDAETFEHSVTFDGNGSAYEMSRRTTGTTTYEFAGWNTKRDGSGTTYEAGDEIDPQGQVTLYAQWNATTDILPVTPPTLSAWDGRDFLGWNTAPDGSGTPYEAGVAFAPTDEVTVLYAQWEEVTRTLTFDLGGGMLNGSPDALVISAKDGETITIPDAPTREGYTFLYWEGSRYYPGDAYTVAGDHSFTAVWEKDDATSAGAQPTDPGAGQGQMAAGDTAPAPKAAPRTAAELPATGDDVSLPLLALGLAAAAFAVGGLAICMRGRRTL